MHNRRARAAQAVARLLGPAGLAVLTGCAAGSAPTATPVAPPAATVAPAALVAQAIQATNALTSYHFLMTVIDNGAASPPNIFRAILEPPSAVPANGAPGATPLPVVQTVEGDFVAPDKAHETVTQDGQAVETLTVGGTTYIRAPNGAWQTPTPGPWPADLPTFPPDFPTLPPASPLPAGPAPAAGVQPNIAQTLLALIPPAAVFAEGGQEPIDGVPTRHLVATVDIPQGTSAPWVASSGTDTVALWIDPAIGVIRQLVEEESADVRITFPAAPGAGTPTAPPRVMNTYHSTITLVLSRPDDPTITVPAP